MGQICTMKITKEMVVKIDKSNYIEKLYGKTKKENTLKYPLKCIYKIINIMFNLSYKICKYFLFLFRGRNIFSIFSKFQ